MRVLLFSCLAILSCSSALAGPHMVLEPNIFDLGTIGREAPARVEVLVKNDGNDELVIEQVTTSCGCIKFELEENQKRVAPGGSTVGYIVADPAHIGSFDFRRTLTFHTNEPGRRRVSKDVFGTVDPEYTLEPADLNFGVLSKGEPGKLDVILRQRTDEPFEVLGVDSLLYDKSVLKVAYEKRAADAWADPKFAEYVIHLELDTAQLTPGLVSPKDVQLSIRTDLKRLGEYRVGVTGDVVSFYRMYPRRPLTVNLVPDGFVPPMATSTLQIVGERPFEVTGVTCESGKLAGTVRPGNSPNSVFIDVAPVPGANAFEGPDFLWVLLRSGDEIVRQKVDVNIISQAEDPHVRRGASFQR